MKRTGWRVVAVLIASTCVFAIVGCSGEGDKPKPSAPGYYDGPRGAKGEAATSTSDSQPQAQPGSKKGKR